jgi:hypothetical protein
MDWKKSLFSYAGFLSKSIEKPSLAIFTKEVKDEAVEPALRLWDSLEPQRRPALSFCD